MVAERLPTPPSNPPETTGDQPHPLFTPPLEPPRTRYQAPLRPETASGGTQEGVTVDTSSPIEARVGSTEVVDIDRLTLTGIKYALAERRAVRVEAKLATPQHQQEVTPPKQSRKDKKHEQRALWGEAAAKDQPFGEVKEDSERFSKGDVLWPKTRKEEAIAQRAYRAKDHRKVALATMRVAEGGTYEIDPETGKSKHRAIDPELKQFSRATRKSIKKEEKRYEKQRKKVEHADHILHPHHKQKKEKVVDRDELQKKAQERRAQANKRKTEAQVATARRDVRQLKRRAFASETGQAWQEQTDETLGHREAFYGELGNVLEGIADGRDVRLTMPRYDQEEIAEDSHIKRRSSRFIRGGAIEGIAATRASRHKRALNFYREKDYPKLAERKEKDVRDTAAKRRKHASTTSRRQNNRTRLNKRRNETRQRYQELRTAKRRLRDLQQPVQTTGE